MARGQRLLNEISIDELLTLRNEGYSNAEIAEFLEVTPNTIWRLIGKNPPGIGRTRWRDHKKIVPKKYSDIPEKPEEVPEEPPKVLLQVVDRKVRMKGMWGTYDIFAAEQAIDMYGDGDVVGKEFNLSIAAHLGVDDIPKFVAMFRGYADELEAIHKQFPSKPTMELITE